MKPYIDPRDLAALTGDHGAIPSRVIHGPAIHLRAEAYDEPSVGARIFAAATDPAGLLAALAVVLWAIFI